jgi:hypothetical protein
MHFAQNNSSFFHANRQFENVPKRVTLYLSNRRGNGKMAELVLKNIYKIFDE